MTTNLNTRIYDLTYVPNTAATLIGTNILSNGSSLISYDMGASWTTIQSGFPFGGTEILSRKTGWTSRRQITGPGQAAMYRIDDCLIETQVISDSVSTCQSYTWGVTGQTYTQSGTYDASLITVEGCDSVLQSHINPDRP